MSSAYFCFSFPFTSFQVPLNVNLFIATFRSAPAYRSPRKGYSGSGSACGVTARRLTALSAPPAEYSVVPVEQAVPLPEGVSVEQGACLGIPGITAHRAVHVAGQVEGRTALMQGGAGAVGAWAVQLAHRAGARVIAICREAGDQEIPARAGAKEVLLADETLAGRIRH